MNTLSAVAVGLLYTGLSFSTLTKWHLLLDSYLHSRIFAFYSIFCNFYCSPLCWIIIVQNELLCVNELSNNATWICFVGSLVGSFISYACFSFPCFIQNVIRSLTTVIAVLYMFSFEVKLQHSFEQRSFF